MLKSRLCDYGDLYILVKQNVTVVGAGTTNFQIFLWEPFVDCITEINNTQVGNTKDLDVIMPMYNLIEYKVYYSKSFRRLWQYCRDEPDNNKADSESFKFK